MYIRLVRTPSHSFQLTATSVQEDDMQTSQAKFNAAVDAATADIRPETSLVIKSLQVFAGRSHQETGQVLTLLE
jgi:hypothetical protein